MSDHAPSTDALGGFHGAFRQSMSWFHTWVGLTLSVVLYFMFVTGTAGYFQTQITRWMEPERGVQSGAALPHDAAAMAEAAVARGLAEIPDATALYVGWPVEGATQSDYYVYAEGPAPEDGGDAPVLDEKLDPATLQAAGEGGVRETGGGEALYVMHYDLHYIPFTSFTVLGYTLPALPTLIVGVATMFMLVAIVTGVVVHKKIFADMFTFRPGKGQRSWLDAHNLSSVLALPFMVMITYSGLLMYTFEYMPTARDVAYGISDEARERFEHETYPTYNYHKAEPAGVAAPMAPVSAMIEQARASWDGLEPKWIDLYNAGDRNARALVWSEEAPAGGYETLWFDATTGEALPPVPAAAANPVTPVVDVFYALHEGTYAGPFLRWLYFASGAIGAAMIATGLVLWTTKRRAKLRAGGRPDAGLVFVERTNVGIVAGLLIGVAAYFWANRLLPVGMEERAAWEMHALFLAWGATFVHAALRPARRAWVEQFAVAALAWGLLPVVNALTTEVHLGRSLPVGDWTLAGFDLTALALAAVFALASRKALRSARAASAPAPARARPARRASPIMEPAE